MRVLLLTQFYPPVIGGEERHVRNLAAELIRRGHDVCVATQWSPGLQEREVDNGAKIYRLRGTMRRAGWLFRETERPHAPPFPDPELVVGIRRLMQSEKPDIVHAHNWMVHSYTPLKSMFDAPLVATLHDYSLTCPKKTLLRDGRLCDGPAAAKCLSCATQLYGVAKGVVATLGCAAMGAVERRTVDMFIPVSRAVAELNGLKNAAVNFEVIPNFIPDDLENLSSNPDACLNDLPADFMLFVGDFRDYKGVHVLLDAYSRMSNAAPLVLVGRPTQEIQTVQAPGVQVFNNWPHSAVMHAWSRCLFGVAPSIGPEPCSTSVIEGMAMGKPMIVTDIGGMPDLVAHGRTGFVVPPNDPIALAGAMQTLLVNSNLRSRMGESCHDWVEKLRARSVVSRIVDVYETLLQRRNAPARCNAAASALPRQSA